MDTLIAFACGFIFAVGLAFSGMTDPKNVSGFLDVFGEWNPRLLAVMAGAILVHAISFRYIKRRPSPLLASEFHLPLKSRIDNRLIIGAAIFGLGWGIAGYCPGPGIVSMVTLDGGALIFVISMAAGMYLESFFEK